MAPKKSGKAKAKPKAENENKDLDAAVCQLTRFQCQAYLGASVC